MVQPGRPGARGGAAGWAGAVVLLFAVGTAGSPSSAQARTVTLLFTGGLRGNIRPACDCPGQSHVAGMAELATYVKLARMETGDVLLLDLGDAVGEVSGGQDVPEEMMLEVLSAVGYDAVALGDNEIRHLGLRGQDGLADSLLPTVCANVVDEATGRLVASRDSVVIRTASGVRVGIAAVMDPELVIPEVQTALGIKVLPAQSVLARVLPKLRQKADLVVLLAHASPEAARSLATMRDAPEVVLCGHPQAAAAAVTEEAGRAVLAAALPREGEVGEITLTLGADGRVAVCEGQLVRIPQDLPADVRAAGLLERLSEPNGDGGAERFGAGDAPDELRAGEMALQVLCSMRGLKVSLGDICFLANARREASALDTLAAVAQGLGLRVQHGKVCAEDLLSLPVPVLVRLLSGGYAVAQPDGGGDVAVSYPNGRTELISAEGFRERYAGFALLVNQPGEAFALPAREGPDLRSDACFHDFGGVEAGQVLTHTFRLRNVGREELIIQHARTACDCVSAVVSASRVPPGGEAALTVSFNTEGRGGPETQRVVLETNDPATPRTLLTISCIVQPAKALLHPSQIALGTVPKGQGSTATFPLLDSRQQPFAIKDLTAGSPFLTAAAEASRDPGWPGYRITVTLSAQTPPGELCSNITIRCDHPTQPVLSIPVTATVERDLRLEPSCFFFGRMGQGEARSASVTLTSAPGTDVKIGPIRSAVNWAVVEVSSAAPGRSYVLTATLSGDLPAGMHRGEVYLSTSSTDLPEVVIPIYALVEGRWPR